MQNLLATLGGLSFLVWVTYFTCGKEIKLLLKQKEKTCGKMPPNILLSNVQTQIAKLHSKEQALPRSTNLITTAR